MSASHTQGLETCTSHAERTAKEADEHSTLCYQAVEREMRSRQRRFPMSTNQLPNYKLFKVGETIAKKSSQDSREFSSLKDGTWIRERFGALSDQRQLNAYSDP
jgi:hypothetical protein